MRRVPEGLPRAWARASSARALALLALGTVAPIASAAEVGAYASAPPSAGEIYLNIVRGDQIRDYLASSTPFSVPALWLCGIIISLFASVWFFLPRDDGIDRAMMLACGSRSRFWRVRSAALVLVPVVCLAWRALSCVLIALLMGGSASFTDISPPVDAMFQEQSPLVWDQTWLVVSAVIELSFSILLSLSVGLLAGSLDAPLGFAFGICYMVASVFTCSPALLGNAAMACRVQVMLADPASIALAAGGTLPLIVVCVVSARRLMGRDLL